MLAIIQTGGKQYLVSKGDKIKVEKLLGEKGTEVSFSQVLLRGEKDDLTLGKPFLEQTEVVGRILRQFRGDKIHVLKYKAKSKYRRKIGHRQHYTEIEITKI